MVLYVGISCGRVFARVHGEAVDEEHGPVVIVVFARGVVRMECRWSQEILTLVSKAQFVLGFEE